MSECMNDVTYLWWFSGLSVLSYNLHWDKSKGSRVGMLTVGVSISSLLTVQHGSSYLVSSTLIFSFVKWTRCIPNLM